MKKLLILPLLVFLSGCVSYYYPETALEDGVYYAEDDPKYVVYQGGYPGAAYYPWSSLDYFYMGFNPYPRYTYYYGFPFGFSYGYSPWYYPYNYYGYYSPLYYSHYHYPYFPAWRPYNGYCAHDRVCGGQYYTKAPGSEKHRFAKTANEGRRHSEKEDTDGDDGSASAIDSVTYNTKPYSRYVSTTPAGYSGNRGMVIRSGKTTKIGKSRIQPIETGPSSNGIVIAASPSQTIVSSGPGAPSGSPATATTTRPTSARSSSPSASHPSSRSTSRASSGHSNRSRSSSRSSSYRAPNSKSSPNQKHHN